MDGEPKSVGKCILFRFLLKVGRGDGWVGAKRNRERRNGVNSRFHQVSMNLMLPGLETLNLRFLRSYYCSGKSEVCS